jgi:hypothetical protein
MNVQSVRDLKLQIAIELFTPHLNDLIQRSTLPTLDHLQFPILPTRIGIGIGIGRRPGEFSLAIRVRERIPPIDAILQRLIAMAHNEVDIVETGQVRLFMPSPSVDAQTLRARCRPLVIGCSVAHVTATAGTLSFMARHNKTNRTVLVSNSHVFAHSGAAKIGDSITQPGRIDGTAGPIGALLDYVPLKPDGSNQVDGAIALPDPAIDLQPNSIPGIGNFTLVGGGDVLPNMSVTKVGRSSGLTRGIVTAVEFDHILVDSEIGNVTFDGQIEIKGTEHAFSQLGDSGSLVVADQKQAIGIVFCGNEFANNGLGVTYANPLPKVMDALNLSPL